MLLNSKPLLPIVPLEVDTAVVHKPHPHDSARMHVRGAAPYVDDIREPTGTLHVGIGMSNKAAGTLRSLDLDAVRAAPGVVAVLTAADIPGKNDIAPAFADEPLFADKEILFHGQALFAVVARTRDQARRAARLAQIDIAEAKPAITVDDAMQTGARVLPDYEFCRGDIEGALGRLAASAGGDVPHRRAGAFLPRGSGLARDPRRGPRDARARLDAGPDRGAAHRGADPRRARRVRQRGDAADGRRFRRQGEPGLRLGRRSPRSAPKSPAPPARSGSTATTISY